MKRDEQGLPGEDDVWIADAVGAGDGIVSDVIAAGDAVENFAGRDLVLLVLADQRAGIDPLELRARAVGRRRDTGREKKNRGKGSQ